jgi:hypothetical protein
MGRPGRVAIRFQSPAVQLPHPAVLCRKLQNGCAPAGCLYRFQIDFRMNAFPPVGRVKRYTLACSSASPSKMESGMAEKFKTKLKTV